MTIYNMLDAKNNLSKICKKLADGDEDYILIANNGKPVAKIVYYNNEPKKRIGVLEKKFKYSDAFDEYNDEISEMIWGE